MSEEIAPESSSSDVHRLTVDGREFVLVGTAHISQKSVDLVRQVIERERPDRVCIELDKQRHEALSHERRFEAQDLREIIRKQQLATLMMNLLLASYQKRLGMKLGVTPGRELLEASLAADELGIPISLCDRDVRITLRRAWSSLSLWRKSVLVSSLLAGVLESPEISEQDLERLRQQDVLSELMKELGEALPELKRVLIDERDGYLAQKIRSSEGGRLVAVVGAGHVEGMKRALLAGGDIDLAELESVAPVSSAWKWAGWSIPALIVGSIAWIGLRQGSVAAGYNALYWFLANAIPAGLGGLLAFAHPATVAAAFFAAPFTSLSPLIGVGYVAAFVQVWFRPPKVHEFHSVGDDIAHVRGWWRNRLLRVLLAFILTTAGSLIGTWVGGIEVVKNVVAKSG